MIDLILIVILTPFAIAERAIRRVHHWWTVSILLLTACSGGDYNARVSNDGSTVALVAKDVTHDTQQQWDSGIAPASQDSGMRGVGSDAESGEASYPNDSGTHPRTEASTIPDTGHADPCLACKTGTYGERPCCKLLPAAHCGVIFTGDNRSCIEYR